MGRYNTNKYIHRSKKQTIYREEMAQDRSESPDAVPVIDRGNTETSSR
jgi:hypothetical protein